MERKRRKSDSNIKLDGQDVRLESSEGGEHGARIDDLDVEIMRELQRDARQSSAVIARTVGTGEALVRRRIKRLLDNETIKVVAIAAPPQFGLRTYAHIAIQAEMQHWDEACRILSDEDEIHYVSLTAGRYDIIAWGMFKSPKALSEFIQQKVASIPGIVRTETLIALDVRKITYGWLSVNFRPSENGKQ